MITSKITDSGVLIVQPSGPISADDFAVLRGQVDHWLEGGGTLKGLLIDAPNFSGWKDFDGLSSHLGFVRDHHRLLARVAFVSDNRFLSALPAIGRHFVEAEVKHFEVGEITDALAWIESPTTSAHRAIRHAWFPEQKLMWISVDGKVTTECYRELLADMESILAETSPISFLIDLDDLEGVEFGAMMSDMKFGFTHIKSFRRIAMVGNEKWCQRIASLPNPFSLEIKAFDEGSEHEAWDWIIQQP